MKKYWHTEKKEGEINHIGNLNSFIPAMHNTPRITNYIGLMMSIRF